MVPSTVSDRRRVATSRIDFRPRTPGQTCTKQAATWAQSAACEARGRPHSECTAAFSCHLHGRVSSCSNHSSLPAHVRGNSRHWRAERAFSDGAGQRARGCKVILLIIQQAAVRCKERTKTKKTKKRRGFCPKSPRRCCLLIHSGVSVSQSVLSKIPTLS